MLRTTTPIRLHHVTLFRSLGAAIGNGILLSVAFRQDDITSADVGYMWIYFVCTIFLSFLFIRLKAKSLPAIQHMASVVETELRTVGSVVDINIYRIVPELTEYVTFMDELLLNGLVWMGGKKTLFGLLMQRPIHNITRP